MVIAKRQTGTSPSSARGAFAGRRGVNVLELVFAIGILSVMLLSLTRVVATAANQRRELARRQVATQEVANLLERITSRDWDEIREPALSSLALSPRAIQALPATKLTVEVEATPGPPEAKRIVVEIAWEAHGGDAVAATRMTAWKHRHREASP